MSRIATLLSHPWLWRARSAANNEHELASPSSANRSDKPSFGKTPTGFAQLDDWLPDGGWPTRGLIEILGEPHDESLYLLAPMLATLFFSAQHGKEKTSNASASALAWVAPPHEPYPPAFIVNGIDIKHILIVRTDQSLWAMEQILRSAACRLALGWIDNAPGKNLRRLQLAAEEANSLGILLRPLRFGGEPSPALLRLSVEREDTQLKVSVIKSRGGRLGVLRIPEVARNDNARSVA
jgi:hypothetical protein